ncbi:MAG TPA: hypothetical protein VKV80_06085 [Streptosporangiaceae bacterium]|nr:hypothetical protein [Streptosporangiaceae bacterium]
MAWAGTPAGAEASRGAARPVPVVTAFCVIGSVLLDLRLRLDT